MKKYTLPLLLLLVAAIFVSGCSAEAAEVTAEPTTTQPNPLIAEGRLMPVNALDQSFSLPGQIAEVLVQDGETVQAGQVLARLNDSPEAALALRRAQQEALAAQQALDALRTTADVNLAQARVAVFAAQTQLETAQEAYDTDATDENQALLDQAAALLAQAEANLAELEANDGIDPDLLAAATARLSAAEASAVSAQAALDALLLKSTLAGAVVDLSLQPGQRVPAGQPVITIADFSTWVVETQNLTEIELVNVAVGQQVELVLDALPEVTLRGDVTHINARYTEARGDITYTATILLSETDARMRWGMTAAVQFLP